MGDPGSFMGNVTLNGDLGTAIYTDSNCLTQGNTQRVGPGVPTASFYAVGYAPNSF